MSRTLNGRLVRRITDGQHQKRCRCCDEWKPLDEKSFQFIKTTGAWQPYCRPCLYAKNAARQRLKKAAA